MEVELRYLRITTISAILMLIVKFASALSFAHKKRTPDVFLCKFSSAIYWFFLFLHAINDKPLLEKKLKISS